MCKFEKIIIGTTLDTSVNLHYIPFVQACFKKYFKYLQDDFSTYSAADIKEFIIDKSPFFWVVLDYEDTFMGFVYLDNFTGGGKVMYSAELTTCFDKKAWGSFIRYSAKFFLKKCFDEFGLSKIKAQIYPENFRVKKLLKDCGFVYESTLKNETIRLGKLQDIEVYGLYRNYYYKNER